MPVDSTKRRSTPRSSSRSMSASVTTSTRSSITHQRCTTSRAASRWPRSSATRTAARTRRICACQSGCTRDRRGGDPVAVVICVPYNVTRSPSTWPARHVLRVPPLLRHAPSGARPRHSYHPGAFRPPRRRHHNDLHARPPPRSPRREKRARPGVSRINEQRIFITPAGYAAIMRVSERPNY